MKKNYTGFLGDLSDEQQKALDIFKKEVTAQGFANPPYDDVYLLRFLRARKFDLTKTLLMWNNFVKWRKENQVDQIETFKFPELPQVKMYYPHGYFRTDKQGRPIYIERIGQLKIKELFKATSEERLIKYYIQSYEKLLHVIFPACSVAVGRRVEQCVTILDLKGTSTSMMSKQVWNFIKLASSIAQDNYPEILGRMFIINAPMLFSGIWAVIKPWLDEKTKAKITIIGSKYESQLLEIIDAQNMPDFLGGKAKVADYGQYLDREQGPWVKSVEYIPISQLPIAELKISDNKEENKEEEIVLPDGETTVGETGVFVEEGLGSPTEDPQVAAEGEAKLVIESHSHENKALGTIEGGQDNTMGLSKN